MRPRCCPRCRTRRPTRRRARAQTRRRTRCRAPASPRGGRGRVVARRVTRRLRRARLCARVGRGGGRRSRLIGFQGAGHIAPVVLDLAQQQLHPRPPPKRIGIERLHLEQDAGKSIHDLSPNETYVDLNRSGCALMEIVSKPDMRSADEAKAYGIVDHVVASTSDAQQIARSAA